MSSSSAGKFQDHYAILGVEPTADQTTILAAYTTLSEKYDPFNGPEPNGAKYKAVSVAHEILSDPSAREAFDQLRGNPQQEGPHKFSGPKFFETVASEPTRRIAILCLLYDRARQRPTKPGLSVRQTEAILNMSGDDMRFAVAYLKQRGLAMSDDKSNLLITVDGMDYVEKANPDPATILAWFTDKTAAPEEADPVKEEKPAAVQAPPRRAAAPDSETPRATTTQSENLAARIRTRMAIPRPPAVTP